MHLDENYQPCTEKSAAFESVSTETNRSTLKPERRSEIRFYGPHHLEEAETLSRNARVNPVGEGGPDSELNLSGWTFHWSHESRWESHHTTFSVIIPADTDKADALRALNCIRKVEQTILSRGLAGNEPIRFHLGGPQWDKKKPNVAGAVDYQGKHIHLFACENGSHMIAAKLDEAGRPLENVILHELGHLLEPLLQGSIRELETTIRKELPTCRSMLKTISPHYLGEQIDAICSQLQTLNEIIQSGAKSILVGKEKEKWDPEKYRAQWLYEITHEIAAEAIRHFYLLPCLHREPPVEIATGWKELDAFTHRLAREARITQSRKPAELFPMKRKNRHIPLLVTIQDQLSP